MVRCLRRLGRARARRRTSSGSVHRPHYRVAPAVHSPRERARFRHVPRVVEAWTTSEGDSTVQTRRIGNREVSAIGLGEMPMSIEGRPDRQRSIATIHAALDAGVTFIDTADAYHQHADEVGHGESLVAEALASYGGDTSGVLVATKGGHLRPGDGSWTVNGRPEYLKQAREASLKRLGVDAIGLYQFHRPDPKTPYARLRRRDPRPARRGQDPDGGHLEREPRPDPAGAGDPRRPARERAEPVLAGLPVEPARARALRPAGHRVPAVEPARRHQQGGRSGSTASRPSSRSPTPTA